MCSLPLLYKKVYGLKGKGRFCLFPGFLCPLNCKCIQVINHPRAGKKIFACCQERHSVLREHFFKLKQADTKMRLPEISNSRFIPKKKYDIPRQINNPCFKSKNSFIIPLQSLDRKCFPQKLL